MTNPAAVTCLVNIEIEAKIGAAIHAEVSKGKQVADWGKRDSEQIAKASYDNLSPAAKQQLIKEGVRVMVMVALGKRIADAIWDMGCGWTIPDSEVRRIATGLNFADLEEAVECLDKFREALPDFGRDEIEGHQLDRFVPLFVAQPEGATLGEIATRKAMHGDKLALSFLAWREIA